MMPAPSVAPVAPEGKREARPGVIRTRVIGVARVIVVVVVIIRTIAIVIPRPAVVHRPTVWTIVVVAPMVAPMVAPTVVMRVVSFCCGGNRKASQSGHTQNDGFEYFHGSSCVIYFDGVEAPIVQLNIVSLDARGRLRMSFEQARKCAK